MKPSCLRPLLITALSLCLFALSLGTLRAQATKIFVASYGNDANDGSRGSPKRNFQAAHDAVAGGGEIVVLDTAGYGALVITKSLSVIVPPGVNGFVTVSGNTSGIFVKAGNGDSVTLRGLIIEGGSSQGILVNSAGTVAIEDCTVRDAFNGIVFQPSAAQFSINRCEVRGCTNAALTAKTTGASPGAVAGVVTACRFEEDDFGVSADARNGGRVDLTFDNCVISGTTTTAIGALSASAVVRVSNCTITDNAAGAVTGGSGAQILSRGNNTLEDNTQNNVFTGSYSVK